MLLRSLQINFTQNFVAKICVKFLCHVLCVQTVFLDTAAAAEKLQIFLRRSCTYVIASVDRVTRVRHRVTLIENATTAIQGVLRDDSLVNNNTVNFAVVFSFL